MSLHDDLIGGAAMPTLMHNHATRASVTVVSNDSNVAEDVDAVLGPIEARDEVLPDGSEVKELERYVLLSTDDLPDDYTNATVFITEVEEEEAELWTVERIMGKTSNGHRLLLRRKRARAMRKRGHYLS